MDLLARITNVKGLENKLHHLYTPDTDMNDKICENLKFSKEVILLDIKGILLNLRLLARKIFEIKEEV